MPQASEGLIIRTFFFFVFSLVNNEGFPQRLSCLLLDSSPHPGGISRAPRECGGGDQYQMPPLTSASLD